MTTNYTIEITSSNTHFKLTYRDKKFKKLEHLKGKLTDELLKHVGKIIPRHEDDFEKFKLEFGNRVHYLNITKEKSLYTNFLDEWISFYEGFAEMPPKFTGADGKALKSIITHLKLLASGNEPESLELWKLILDKWHTLSDFHKDNTDLKYINSKLNIILNAIKKQNNTIASKSGGSVEL